MKIVNFKKMRICKGKCEDKFAKDKKHCKVRNHCHYTGEYRGAAHSIYNLSYMIPKRNYHNFS